MSKIVFKLYVFKYDGHKTKIIFKDSYFYAQFCIISLYILFVIYNFTLKEMTRKTFIVDHPLLRTSIFSPMGAEHWPFRGVCTHLQPKHFRNVRDRLKLWIGQWSGFVKSSLDVVFCFVLSLKYLGIRHANPPCIHFPSGPLQWPALGAHHPRYCAHRAVAAQGQPSEGFLGAALTQVPELTQNIQWSPIICSLVFHGFSYPRWTTVQKY